MIALTEHNVRDGRFIQSVNISVSYIQPVEAKARFMATRFAGTLINNKQRCACRCAGLMPLSVIANLITHSGLQDKFSSIFQHGF